jgi:hypothetical protein
MQNIYNYIPQRKHISRVTYNFAGILYLKINASCIIIIIIIIIINILLLPQTSHVLRYRRNFAAILRLQHVVHLMIFPILNIFSGVVQWLRHCATSRAVPGSNPGGFGHREASVTGTFLVDTDRTMCPGVDSASKNEY